jgi:hypothetical protein
MRPLLLLPALLIAACETTPSNTLVRVETTPPGAVLSIDGFGECETPCTIEIDREREAQLAKAGFNPQKIILRPGVKTLAIAMELAAPTTTVDEASIPEL